MTHYDNVKWLRSALGFVLGGVRSFQTNYFNEIAPTKYSGWVGKLDQSVALYGGI